MVSCDGSLKGFGAIIHLVTVSSSVKTYRVMAKSKVAPLEQISIPRIELCAAAPTAKLTKIVLDNYQCKIDFSNIVFWSDSTLALTWLKYPPYNWKIFVGNRFSYIQERVSPSSSRHVPTGHNPADAANLPNLPNKLRSHSLW